MIISISRSSFLGALLTSTGFYPSLHNPDPFFLERDFFPSNTSITTAEDLSRLSAQIRAEFSTILDQDPTLAGPLLRLAFHDATTFERSQGFVSGGPNGSIRFELGRSENRGLGRPLEVVEKIRSATNQLSFADAVALGGSVAVEHAGGPHIPIRLGRNDTDRADAERLRVPLRKTKDRSFVETTLPSAGLNSDGLRLYFGRLGLSEAEFVSLSGSHGLGRHVSLLGMSKECLKNLTRECLEEAPTMLPFVSKSVDRFDNSYFQALLNWYNRQVSLGEVAFIPTDVALVVDRGLRKHVLRFASDEPFYFKTFAQAYQKLVDTTGYTKNRY